MCQLNFYPACSTSKNNKFGHSGLEPVQLDCDSETFDRKFDLQVVQTITIDSRKVFSHRFFMALIYQKKKTHKHSFLFSTFEAF